MRRLLRSAAGFTFSEMLVALLILSLSLAVVAGGLPAAQSSYFRVLDSANAQMLLSTTVSRLRDELAMASRIVAQGQSITYRSGSTGSTSAIRSDGGGILLAEYLDLSAPPEPSLLVPQKAATSRLHAAFTAATYDAKERVVTISGLVVRNLDGEELASLPELQIRVIGARH